MVTFFINNKIKILRYGIESRIFFAHNILDNWTVRKITNLGIVKQEIYKWLILVSIHVFYFAVKYLIFYPREYWFNYMLLFWNKFRNYLSKHFKWIIGIRCRYKKILRKKILFISLKLRFLNVKLSKQHWRLPHYHNS